MSISKQHQQTISFDALPDLTWGVAPFTVSATASSGLPVSFESDPDEVCTISGKTVTVHASGTCSIVAVQYGDKSFEPAPDVLQSFKVHHAVQSITFPAPPSTPLATGSVTLNAKASSGLPVSFASASSSVCSISGSTAKLLSAGTCKITASQPGNAQYGPASSWHSFAVTLAAQTITFAPLPERSYGNPPFAVSAKASSGLPVSFASSPATVCTMAGDIVTLHASGTCIVVASQGGNTSYAAAPVVKQSFTVHHEVQSITFAAIPSTPLAKGSVSLSATASSGMAVSFASSAPSVCSVSGSTAKLLALGTCAITASQAGNAQYAAASAARTFAVTLPPQTITFAALPEQSYGAPPFAVTATASSGLPVSFASSPVSVCTVSGKTVTLHASGTCTIVASQAGNSSFAPAPKVPQSFIVHHRIQTLSFAFIPSPLLSSGSVNLNATASSGLPVAFSTSTPSVCGVSGSTAKLVAAGTCTIVAYQAGNEQYGPIASSRNFVVVAQAAPILQWGASYPIGINEPLSGAGLAVTAIDSATKAIVAGTVTWVPDLSTRFSASGKQSVTARFTPSDTARYLATQSTTTVNVVPFGVVCWGDSLMGGASRLAVPLSLARLITLPVVNEAVGAQTSTQIGVRQGGVKTQAIISGGVIPGSGPVPISFQPQGYEPVTYGGPLLGVNGSIGGVEGTVTYTPEGLVFTRAADGDPVTISHPMPFVVETPYSDYLPVFWEGRDNFGNSARVLSDIAAQVANVPSGQDYVVLSILNGDDPLEYKGGVRYQEISSLNNQLRNFYDSHFVDVRTILIDAYDPNSTLDLSDLNHDVPPTSLRAIQGAGTLMNGIGPSDTTLNVNLTTGMLKKGLILTLDTGANVEKVQISSVSGAMVTVVRGLAGTAAAHLAGASVTEMDNVHLNGQGLQVVATAIADYLQSHKVGNQPSSAVLKQ